LVFTVQRHKTIVLRLWQILLLVFVQFCKTIGGIWFLLLVLWLAF
jgi:hypothetical protein